MSNFHMLTRRVARLEGAGAHGEIPVWCENPADLDAAVSTMIADGEIEPHDVARCVFWSAAKGTAALSHEVALANLECSA